MENLFGLMFITVACVAISGFHSTQSPVARCIENEKNGRKIFYGAMVAEGVIALFGLQLEWHFIMGLITFSWWRMFNYRL